MLLDSANAVLKIGYPVVKCHSQWDLSPQPVTENAELAVRHIAIAKGNESLAEYYRKA